MHSEVALDPAHRSCVPAPRHSGQTERSFTGPPYPEDGEVKREAEGYPEDEKARGSSMAVHLLALCPK